MTRYLTKISFLSGLALTLGTVPSAAEGPAAPSPSNVEIRDAATHDELSQSLRMAQQSDPLRDLGPAIGKTDEDPSVVQSKRDFVKNSTVLSYRGLLTFVPKRAVLHLPDNLSDRIGVKPDVEVKTWPEFYRANRGWIRTIEVTREQALGHTALPEAKREAIENSSSMVVATFRNGPISVLPPKDPEDSETGATASDEKQEAKPSATSPTR